MAQANVFMNLVFAQNETLINALETVQVLIDRTVQEPNLVADYFSSPSHRTDIDASAVNAALAAWGQIVFAFNSGSPPQKAAMYNLL